MEKKYLISIVGPTAIGKTSKSIAIAESLNTEIISCDSRQFYKEMTIGTAVPDQQELKTVKHHFIQNISIFNQYNVGDYEKEALQLIEEKFKTNEFLCLTGGSGLYQNAVIKGLDYFPEVDKNIREELNGIFKNQGLQPLQKQLEELDPEYHKIVDLNNPHRIIRALEICIGTSKPYSSYLKNRESNKRNFNSIKIGLTAERKVIYDRIEIRVDNMIESGLIEEAKSLYPHRSLNALQTVGYKELFDFFDNKISLEKAIEEIKKNTRRYAKRQMTWFRKQDDIKWFNFEVPLDDILSYIHKKTRSTIS